MVQRKHAYHARCVKLFPETLPAGAQSHIFSDSDYVHMSLYLIVFSFGFDFTSVGSSFGFGDMGGVCQTVFELIITEEYNEYSTVI